MQFRKLTLPSGELYYDTMSYKSTPVRWDTCAQIYGDTFGYIKAYPMDVNDKQNLGDSISLIIQDAGVMQELNTENSP